MVKLSIELFDPPNASQKIWDDYYSHYIEIFQELSPDDPCPSIEMLQKLILIPSPHYQYYHWLAYDQEIKHLVGIGRLEFDKKTSPAYDANKNIAFADISIRKNYRRRGFGTELLRNMVMKAKTEGKSIFQSWGTPNNSSSFFEHLGGQKASKEEENRLQLSDVDWQMVQTWCSEGKQRTENVKLEYFETVPEQDIKEFSQIYTEVMNQVPKEDLEWEFNETPEVRRNHEARHKKLGTIWTTIISREGDGTISGLTETYYYPDRQTIVFQGLTGVKVAYRGRGLGKWLKAEMLTYIKENFPKATTIGTDFALVNEPMISINRRLGFKPYKIWVGYKFSVDQLIQTIDSEKKI
ncbi:GNAT family N-acetyltransferase [Candidatus Hodarchaeum mangrovi]